MTDPEPQEADARPTVYVETSVISYLAAKPSADLVARLNQRATHDWWNTRSRFRLVVSEFVVDEISRGDPTYSALRLAAVDGIPLLELTGEVDALAAALLKRASLPAKAAIDAAHVALAAIHGVDFLVTWNLKHIANAVIRHRLGAICADEGFAPPAICTPAQLLEG